MKEVLGPGTGLDSRLLELIGRGRALGLGNRVRDLEFHGCGQIDTQAAAVVDHDRHIEVFLEPLTLLHGNGVRIDFHLVIGLPVHEDERTVALSLLS